ncbi:MAG: hypothetical protein CL878_09805 [Dehalococcoidia bacterium]|nr:hypothetical protein [Dehalococcoidia bacterium]
MTHESILVVDDEPLIASLCVQVLQRDGYSVESIYPPSAALARLEQGHYDLLLTDVVMPEINGLQLME